jgi:GTPase
MIDLLPADGSDPVYNAKAIIAELEKYNPKLAAKPRWLVFNKVDLLLEDEVETLVKKILSELEWDGVYHQISGIQKQGTMQLCHKAMDYISTLPIDIIEELPEEVGFKWDTYHKESMDNKYDNFDDLQDDLDDDDDFDEDDYDVEVIYKK